MPDGADDDASRFSELPAVEGNFLSWLAEVEDFTSLSEPLLVLEPKYHKLHVYTYSQNHYNIMNCIYDTDKKILFKFHDGERKRHNRKLYEGRFKLHTRKYFFTNRIVYHRNLQSENVNANTNNTFKEHITLDITVTRN